MLDGSGKFAGVAAKVRLLLLLQQSYCTSIFCLASTRRVPCCRVCKQEMKEETGLELEASALVDMTELVYGSKPGMPPGLVPSAGGCDEFIRLFW